MATFDKKDLFKTSVLITDQRVRVRLRRRNLTSVLPTPVKTQKVRSSHLMAALNHARELESWPKLAMYLIAVGTACQAAYVEDSSRMETGADYKKFLEQFCNLPLGDQTTVWALRCSLVHSFGLANFGSAGSFRFRIEGDPSAPAITPAKTAWDGRFNDEITEDEKTTIGLIALCKHPRCRDRALQGGRVQGRPRYLSDAMP